jgi:hypothetical protein
METVKLKTQVSHTIEKEVELPYYRKSNCHFWKVIAKDRVIQVTDAIGSCAIETSVYIGSCLVNSDEDSNEKEFNEAFQKAVLCITEDKNK